MPPGRLNRALTDAIDNFKVGDRVKNKSIEFTEAVEASSDDILSRLLSDMGLNETEQANINIRKFTSGDNRQAIGVLGVIPAFIGIIVGVFSGLARPFARKLEYAADREIKSARIDPAQAISAYWRNEMTFAELTDELTDLGYSQKRREILLNTLKSWGGPDILNFAKLRGKISQEEWFDAMVSANIPREQIEFYAELQRVIPGVQDQISFAVREAYDDDVARRFGYDENFPTEVLEFTQKLGLSDSDTRRYWRAHWQLPSPQQAIEMYQRLRINRTANPFTEEDLDTYLRIADIAPRFRDWFKQIAYLPATRVDARRYIEEGILEPPDAYQIFLDQGQSPENAANLVQLGIAIRDRGKKDLSRSAIVRAYTKGLYSYSDAYTVLISVGESPETAEFYLSLATFELEEKRIDNELDRIEFEYVNGVLNDETVIEALAQLQLLSSETEFILREWQIKRRKKIQLPTKADYENWRKQTIIDDVVYRNGLMERGYRDSDINRYLQSLLVEIGESAQKEAERAAKEAERVLQDAASSQYKRDTAQIDVQIAEAKSAKATIELTLFDTEDGVTQIELERRLLSINKQIADLNINKANVRLSFES